MSIVTQSLGQQVFDVLLSRILDGTYRPGDRILPEDVSGEFGISTTPVRDAFHRLRQAGFLSVRAREGVYVSHLDVKRAANVFDVRIALEAAATHAATDRIPQEALLELEACYQQAERELGLTGSEEVLDPIDLLIHNLTLQHCDNDLLKEMLTQLRHQVEWVRTIAGKGAHRYEQSFQEHKEILAALQRRDPEAAAQAMQDHLRRTKSTVLHYLKQTTAETAGSA